MSVPFDFITQTTSLLASKGPGVNLTQSDYSSSFIHSMNKTGVALHDYVKYINRCINVAASNSTYVNLPQSCMLKADMVLLVTVLNVRSLLINL